MEWGKFYTDEKIDYTDYLKRKAKEKKGENEAISQVQRETKRA